MYLLVPILIFFARIIDVSMGTIRVIFTSKGYKYYAAILGFFEVLIWLIAMKYIMSNLSNVFCYIAFAAGFAAGTYAGILLEERLSVGSVIIRIITGSDAGPLLAELKAKRFVPTSLGAEGPDGKVHLIFSVINRKDIPKVKTMVKKFNPNAFYTIEDVRHSNKANEIGLFPKLFKKKV